MGMLDFFLSSNFKKPTDHLRIILSMQFQDFITNRVSFGRYHYLLILSAIFIEMTDGIQTLTISLCTPIIQHHFALTSPQVSLLSSIFSIGVGIGNFVFGIMANSLGRRMPVLIGISIQLISGLLLALNPSFFWLLVGRFLYGVGFGSTIVTTMLLICESIPLKQRGRALLLFNFGGSVGRLVGALLAFLFLNQNSLREGSRQDSAQIQRSMGSMSLFILISTVPCLFSLLINYFTIKESYRYLLAQQNYRQAFKVIDQIIKENGKTALLSLQEEQQLRSMSRGLFRKQSEGSWSLLLSHHKSVTILLSLIWFFNNFILFGEFFIVPMILYGKEEGLVKYLWMTLGQIPVFVLNWFLIETPYFGRKWTLALSFLLSSIFCFIMINQLSSGYLFFAKFFIKESVQVLIPFTPESFPTEVRGLGSGVAQAVGKMGATLMPFVVYPLYQAYPHSPFLVFGICSLVGSATCCLTPSDTYARPLDDNSCCVQLNEMRVLQVAEGE